MNFTAVKRKYISIILALLMCLAGIGIENKNIQSDALFVYLSASVSDRESGFSDEVFSLDKNVQNEQNNSSWCRESFSSASCFSTVNKECRIEENNLKNVQSFRDSQEKEYQTDLKSVSVIAHCVRLSEYFSKISKEFLWQDTIFCNGREMIISYIHHKDGEKDNSFISSDSVKMA